jgi:branched-chain amino acid transport system substrate-binding protein
MYTKNRQEQKCLNKEIGRIYRMNKRISRRQFLAAAGLTAAAAALTACGGSGSSATTAASTTAAASGDATITIGVLAPLSGDASVYGNAVANGAMLYLNKVNNEGGINGKQLNIIKLDEKGDASEAVTCFNRMLDEGIVALIGDVTTTPTEAVVAESQEYNMPMVTASATAEAVTYDAETDTVYTNVFRSTFIDPFQGIKMADYAIQKMGVKTAAVLYMTGNDYSEGLYENFVSEFESLGGTVVDVEAYAKGDVDFNAQLTSIASSNPEVVWCPNYYEDDGKILTQARAQGISVPFIGGDGWDGVKDYASAADLAGCFFCANYATGASEEFESAYQAEYGEAYPNGFAPLGYDAAITMCVGLQAAEDAGLDSVADPDAYKQAVIDAIKGATVEGVTGTFTFDEHNNPVKTASIITFEDGVPTLVEQF